MPIRDVGSGRENRREASSLAAAQERNATVRAVRNVVRRLGVVLGAAHAAAEEQILRHGMVATAETLRDGLKPLIDSLVHFEVEDLDDGDA